MVSFMRNTLGCFATPQFISIGSIQADDEELVVRVRVFDADVGLMSYFEVSSPMVMSETITASAQANGNEIDINSNTELKRLEVAFSLGFGFYF